MGKYATNLSDQETGSSCPVQLSELVNMEDPQNVLKEVKTVILLALPEFDFGRIERTLEDVLKIFSGQYPGYRACNTYFHDIKHTTDTFLAMARLIHGVQARGTPLTPSYVNLGLISALMHDIGYIQELSDTDGTGAKYTSNHINRSINFLSEYLFEKGYTQNDIIICHEALLGTCLSTRPESTLFASKENGLLSKMLGTADLFGQISDRTYLEKLPFLYLELREAGIPGLESELELIKKTSNFYRYIKERFEDELDCISNFMRDHFLWRWGIDRDLYSDTIDSTLKYLEWVLANHEEEYRTWFRRNDVMGKPFGMERRLFEETHRPLYWGHETLT